MPAIGGARQSRLVAAVVGCCCLVAGLLVLVVGWWWGVERIAAPIPGSVPMVADAAAGIALAGLGVLAAAAGWPRWIGGAAGGVLGALGAASVVEYVVGADWHGMDELLAGGPGSSLSPAPGRMAINTALNFVLVGVALVLLSVRRLPGVRQLLGSVAAAVAFGILLGFIMTDVTLSGLGATSWTQTAPLTALCMLSLGVAVVAADISVGWGKVFADTTAGGQLVRMATPALAGLVLATAVLVRVLLDSPVLRPHASPVAIIFLSAAAFSAVLVAARRVTATERARLLDRRQLADSEHRYQLLAKNSTDVVWQRDAQGAIVWVSESVQTVLGWLPQDLIGTRPAEVVHPDDLAVVEAKLAGMAVGRPVPLFETRILAADGDYRWMSLQARPLAADDGSSAGTLAGMRDVHEQVAARQRLAASEQRYRMLAENSTDVVWQLDAEGALVWVSPSIHDELGWDPQQLLGTNVRDLIHPDDRDETANWKAKLLAGVTVPNLESRRQAADGTYRWMSLQGRPTAGAGAGLIIGMRNIDDEVRARTALAHATEHDPLTGLASLPVALARLDRMLAEDPVGCAGRTVGVLCVGVDALKSVNEALTNAAGDQVMLAITTRIAAALDNPDLLARGAGDEFLVLLPDLVNGADAGVIAERVRRVAHGTLALGGHRFEPTVSVGIAAGPPGGHAHELLRDAALAMHQAKDNGRDRCECFQTRLNDEARNRLILADRIRDGLRDGQFVPWFQPVVNLHDGSVVGYEALVRWLCPDGTVVASDDFLPVAERTALIADLDAVVLQQSVEILSRLPASLHVAVNVSAVTLARTDYARCVIEALTRSGVDPLRLHLEFTETAVLCLTNRTRGIMSELADAGVRWYVDDFGTGYSSISHLRDLPVAGLKLDLSFTAGIRAGDRTSERLALGLAGLAEGLGIDTVAEGVDTPEEAVLLMSQGWKHAQGWLYGPAAPASALPLDHVPTPAVTAKATALRSP